MHQNSSTYDLVFKGGGDARAVRVVMLDGEPWWVLADLCDALNLTNPSVVASRLDPDDVSKHTLSSTEGITGNPRVTIVSESGMFDVVLGARSSTRAKAFRRWVVKDVLPSIKRTGSYNLNQLPPTDPVLAQLELLGKLRRDQLAIEQKQTVQDNRLNRVEQLVQDAKITGSQVFAIKALVQKLARERGSNYSAAYHTLYEQFKIASYRDLLARDFERAHTFLNSQITSYEQQNKLIDEMVAGNER
jgi:prophage antirepressor-like protein